MGNCLVTQLKESIQNDALPTLNGFKVKVYGTADADLTNVLIKTNENVTCKVTGNNNIYSYNQSTHSAGESYGQETSLVTNSRICFVDNGEYYADFISKYSLTGIQSHRNISINLDDLKYCSSLVELSCYLKRLRGSICSLPTSIVLLTINGDQGQESSGNDYNFHINTIDLKPYINLKNISFINYNFVSGDFKYLGYSPVIEKVELGNVHTDLFGKLEDFARIQIFLNNSNKSVQIRKGLNITFKNNQSTSALIALSWSPNAVNSNYYDISFDGQETTIIPAVDSAGEPTWTYANSDMSKYTG